MRASKRRRQQAFPREVSSHSEEQPVQETRPRWPPDDTTDGCDLQFIYVLRDPSTGKHNEVFYVGRTKHLLDRYIAHVKGDDKGSAKDERIRLITRGGRLPIMETVHWACSEKEAIYREAYYIHYYLAAGAPLTNATLALNNNGSQGRDHYEIEQWEDRELKRSRLHRWVRKLFRIDNFPYRD